MKEPQDFSQIAQKNLSNYNKFQINLMTNACIHKTITNSSVEFLIDKNYP
jgi:hypothetical protein